MSSFSIVIPTYNGEKYIEDCLLSVLNQCRPADEIIVSDDNSTDSTISICRKYEEKIKIFINKQGPSGFVNGWNNAVLKASGDYVSILHQDDLLDEQFLKEAEAILEVSPGIFHFFTTCNYIDTNGKICGYSYPDTGEIRKYSGLQYVKAYQQEGNPHIHRCPGVITHRTIFQECLYRKEAGHIADDDFFYRVGIYTDVAGLLKPLASYREHNQSETGKLDDAVLVKRLIDDYKYQIRQWTDKSFLDKEAFDFFENRLRKYRKRYLGYGLKQLDLKKIIYALR